MPMTELADAVSLLGPDEHAHLQRLQASWGLLADLCFGDLVLYLAHAGTGAHRGPADQFVIVNHIRPTTSQTIYHSDIIGEVRTPVQRPLVAEACAEGRIVTGEVDSVWLGERLRVQAIPVRCDGRIIAVIAQESAVAVRGRPGELEQVYQRVFDRFSSMIAEGHFPYGDEDVHLSNTPRVGDGVVVLDASGCVEYASPNANSALTRAGVAGALRGRALADAGFESPTVRAALISGLPGVEEVDGPAEVAVAVRALPLAEGGEITGVVVLLRDITDLRVRDRLLLSKDATIREIHHRVKNNLQTISSLLRLQGRRLTEPSAKAAIEESVRRIRSIALVHEALSREAGDAVAVVQVLRPLIRMVEEGLVSTDQPIRFVVSGDGGVVASPTATGLSVVLAELLQNVVEHAFPVGLDTSAAPALVLITVANDGDRLRMTVADDGVGMPADSDPSVGTSLGMSIVRTLVESEMGGTIGFNSGGGTAGRPGTVVELDVPVDSDPLHGV